MTVLDNIPLSNANINTKSIMTVLDNNSLTNAHINKKWGHEIN